MQQKQNICCILVEQQQQQQESLRTYRPSCFFRSQEDTFFAIHMHWRKLFVYLLTSPRTSSVFHRSRILLRQSTTTTTMDPSDAKKRLVFGKDDALFGSIEAQHENRTFGDLLDAGTGMHSLRWIATLQGMTSFTAITADTTMQHNVQREAQALGVDTRGEVLMGNWFGSPLLEWNDRQFDTILVDYLIGAMDGFSPYQQDQMLPKLNALLKPGGRMYIVGLEPLPDQVDGDANVMCRVRQVRDACILLAGHRCYREYPLEWIERQCANIPGLKLVASKKFPILYRHATIVRQINVARSKLPLFQNSALSKAMGLQLDELEKESLAATQRSPTGSLQLGFDYLVTVEKE